MQLGLRGLAVTGLLVWIAWGVGALWFQRPSGAWAGLLAIWIVLGLATLLVVAGMRHVRWLRPAPLLFALAALGLSLWWATLRPSHERVWADDVAQLLAPEIRGNQLVLHNVRNFEWRSEQDYSPRWETRRYDLDKLESVDLILSYWMGPHIAHTLVSFGFSDGQRVAFSLEIRKERNEEFSALAGFFRRYEQVLIAADERDIVRTRSNARGEDVYLYSMKIPPDKARTLLLGYVERAAKLRSKPEFYNSLTSNCTTIVYELARRIAPRLPRDYRLLASGHFAKYVYDTGGLARGFSFAQLQRLGYINPRALASDRTGQDFSTAIRQGVPSATQATAASTKGYQ